MIDSGHDLYRTLQKLYLLEDSPEFWWPNAYRFEVVVGAILTQNSQWQRVEQSLENLRNNHLLSLEAILFSQIPGKGHDAQTQGVQGVRRAGL